MGLRGTLWTEIPLGTVLVLLSLLQQKIKTLTVITHYHHHHDHPPRMPHLPFAESRPVTLKSQDKG